MSQHKTIRAFVLGAIFFLSAVFSLHASEWEGDSDLSAIVKSEGVDPNQSALLIVRPKDGAEWTSGGTRIETRFPPASTSKIPHTLIALETGYADGPDTLFKWDGVERAFDFWNRDQTLSSAYQYSAVWVYQQMTRTLGFDTMSGWISRLDYGNGSIGTPADLTTYWLVGPLETSAREQTDFLSRLARDELPFKENTLQLGKQIMQADQGEGWTLFAKTGWRSDGENTDIGWYVGWLEQLAGDQKHAYVFAFNMDLLEASDRSKRKAVVRAALVHLELIPE